MRTVTMTICILAWVFLAGCNKTDKAAVVALPQAAPAQTQELAVNKAGAESAYTPLAGTMLSLANGKEVEIISVGKFDSDLQSLDGLIALEGRVLEVYADNGRLVLVDTDPTVDCSTGCCPQAQVPVRLALQDFAGDLPAVNSEVIIVGNLSVTKMGYDLVVQEIRQAGKVVLGPKETPEGA